MTRREKSLLLVLVATAVLAAAGLGVQSYSAYRASLTAEASALQKELIRMEAIAAGVPADRALLASLDARSKVTASAEGPKDLYGMGELMARSMRAKGLVSVRSAINGKGGLSTLELDFRGEMKDILSIVQQCSGMHGFIVLSARADIDPNAGGAEARIRIGYAQTK